MVDAFVPRTASFVGQFRLGASVELVFPLFSPLGEKEWVPGWEPEILHPADEDWVEGMVFRTAEESGTAIWVISRLDASGHSVRYHRVEPGHLIARIDVACTPVSGGVTDVSTVYSYVGLSDGGNEVIRTMTEGEYELKMGRWALWLGRCLERKNVR